MPQPTDLTMAEVGRRLDAIEKKIDELIQRHLDAPPPCPKPGECLRLIEHLHEHDRRLQRIDGEIVTLFKLHSQHDRLLSRGLGIATILVLGLTLFAPALRKLLGLE